jgi:hypothetical protein
MRRSLAAFVCACAALAFACSDSDTLRDLAHPTGAPSGTPSPFALLPTPPPTPAPTPVPAPPGNSPPAMAFKFDPQPAVGPAPLQLFVNMCGSSDPDGDSLEYLFKFGDGVKFVSIKCRDSIKYQSPGKFRSFFCVDDGYASHRVCQNVLVTVQ